MFINRSVKSVNIAVGCSPGSQYTLYPQPLYTASQVRTTSRSWDNGVLTDLCLTRVLTDLCLTRVLTELCLTRVLTDLCLTLYDKPTRCNSGSIVFIKNYKYALHVSYALCVHLQEHYKL